MSDEGRSLRAADRSAAPLKFAQPLLSRRALAMAAAGFVAGGAAVGLGWLAAKPHTGARQKSLRQNANSDSPLAAERGDHPKMEVTGASMAPTLLGRHVEARCGACGVTWAAFGLISPGQPLAARCWNCGFGVMLSGSRVLPGSTVQLIPRSAATAAFSVGDLVAVRWPPGELPGSHPREQMDERDALRSAEPPDRSSLSVKRIVALAGQVISHCNGQLLVDGEPILPERIWLPVHDDRYRNGGQSWWQPQSDAAAQTIEQTPYGFRLRAPTGDVDQNAEGVSDWLVYHHRSVHQQLQPDVVRDDVPSNVTEVRSLLPVSQLRLSLQLAVSKPGTLEVAFWDDTTVAIQQLAFSPETCVLEIAGPRRDRRASAAAEAPAGLGRAQPPGLAAERPLALRVVAGEADVKQLRIDRPVEYRIDPRLAATIAWPIRLAADEYYLLGDNVPLSIDSRHFGPAASARIVGRIEPVSYDKPGP